MHWTWSSHWLLQRWDIRQWSARLYVVRKTLETENELGGFWWFGFSEKIRVIPQKRRVPSKQKCGDKNHLFPVFPVKNTFGVIFFEPIMGLAKLTAHLRCHCCGYIWPEMVSGGSFRWMFFSFRIFWFKILQKNMETLEKTLNVYRYKHRCLINMYIYMCIPRIYGYMSKYMTTSSFLPYQLAVFWRKTFSKDHTHFHHSRQEQAKLWMGTA